jgi:hypothetical protein
VAAVLEQDDRHANTAKYESDGEGPKKNDDFVALFPRWPPVINQSAQQGNRRIFWFDASSMGPIARMSTSKWINIRSVDFEMGLFPRLSF